MQINTENRYVIKRSDEVLDKFVRIKLVEHNKVIDTLSIVNDRHSLRVKGLHFIDNGGLWGGGR